MNDPTPVAGSIAAFREGLPGVYRGISDDEYHDSRLCSGSRLNCMAEKSPADAKWEMDWPNPSTPAMQTGTALHLKLLQPDEFLLRFVESEFRDFKTKAAQEWRDEREAAGLTVLSGNDWGLVHQMAKSVTSDPDAGGLLSCITDPELSLIWVDAATGVKIKGRIDGWCGGIKTLMDLKTTESGHPRDFPWSLAKFGYHRKMALYEAGLAAHGMTVEDVAVVTVEKKGRCATATYRITERDLEIGRRENAMLLEQYAECQRSGIWPGYTEGITEMTLPPAYRPLYER